MSDTTTAHRSAVVSYPQRLQLAVIAGMENLWTTSGTARTAICGVRKFR